MRNTLSNERKLKPREYSFHSESIERFWNTIRWNVAEIHLCERRYTKNSLQTFICRYNKKGTKWVTSCHRYHSPGRLVGVFRSNGHQRQHISPFSRAISRKTFPKICLSKCAAVRREQQIQSLDVWRSDAHAAPFSRVETARNPRMQGGAVQWVEEGGHEFLFQKLSADSFNVQPLIIVISWCSSQMSRRWGRFHPIWYRDYKTLVVPIIWIFMIDLNRKLTIKKKSN